jgi:hypothetical protein
MWLLPALVTHPPASLPACRYTHTQDWEAAMRIAEQYDPTSISDILAAQAKAAIQRKQYQVGVGVYVSSSMWVSHCMIVGCRASRPPQSL